MNVIHDSKESIFEILNQHKDDIFNSDVFNHIQHDEFEFSDGEITRMPGAWNITYKVDFNIGENAHSIIFRKFKNKLVDFRIENLIFRQLSESKQGPYLFHQCDEYRIEEYIPSRTVTIFELRNPVFMKQIVNQLASFHCNKTIQSEVLSLLKETNPEPKTCLESFLTNWWKDISDRLELIRSKLTRTDYIEIFEKFVETYYFEGFEEFWIKLLPKTDDKIIAHTDAQETNLLLRNSKPGNPTIDVVIIDYEYAGLIERSWDLANYYIETMLSNWEYSSYPWVELFEDNRMTSHELENLVDLYIEALKDFGGPKLDKPSFLLEVKNMIIVINYYWGAWSMADVDLEKINNDDLYFPAAKIRMRLIEIAKEYFQA